MAVSYSEALRHARLAQITDQVGSNGRLRIFAGTRPAAGGTETQLLADLACSATFAGAPSNNQLEANAISDATADSSGTATWFRVTTSGGAYVIDGDAGESGAELILDDASIVEGGTVSVTSLVVTGGNAG